MINCAIYPRKSKANDNSQSMDQQISECTEYIKRNYNDYTITVYGNDYALTGHSTEKRKDFQRMMNDVRAKKIQLVVIMRYDRIARNMRDFCNLYHDMETNGCNLVSVSQQIDTSTPYGKNFMYQMASMAELEWAITSERYKDTAKYKREHGYAYTGRVPYGYIIEKRADGHKYVVKDPDHDAMQVFDFYQRHKNKNKTVEYIRANFMPNFTYDMLRKMLKTEMYIGKVPGNDHFCEPYLTEKEFAQIKTLKIQKTAPSNKIYIFSQLIQCPICKNRMQSTYAGKDMRQYYRCGYVQRTKLHDYLLVSEKAFETALLAQIGFILDGKIVNAKFIESKQKIAPVVKIDALEKQCERLNYLFEKGRISIDEYERKYDALQSQIKEFTPPQKENYDQIKQTLCDGWQDAYAALDPAHKKQFWHNLIDKIIIDKDKNITDIIFL